MQHQLLKSSLPTVHATFEGQAARHINSVGDEYILCVNAEHRVDVYMRGNMKKLKTLEVEYMRCSLHVKDVVFIGTEEKLCYMVETTNFSTLAKIATQSYVFSIALVDPKTIVCG